LWDILFAFSRPDCYIKKHYMEKGENEKIIQIFGCDTGNHFVGPGVQGGFDCAYNWTGAAHGAGVGIGSCAVFDGACDKLL
jgi:hypothetical protein